MSREVWSYLATYGVNSDEQAYAAHGGMFDVVMPLHGGKLEVDGSWTQEPSKYSTSFAQALPATSRKQGQTYAPVIAQSDDTDDWNEFLDTPAVWSTAVTNLVTLLGSRFDAPWDGAVFNFETTTSSRKDKLTAWCSMLADAVQAEGVDVYIHTNGRTAATDNWYDNAYACDHTALGQIADRLIYDIGGYWLPLPRSLAPYWYIIESLHYVITTCGVPPSKLVASTGCYSNLIDPDVGGGGTEYTHAAAMALIGDTAINWLDANANGALYHNRAVLDDGTVMWLHDGPWMQARLPLLDRNSIDSLGLFRPGWAAPSTWRAIEQWTHRSRRYDRYHGQGMRGGVGSKGGFLVPPG